MNADASQPVNEQEKKTNARLAVAIGVIGLGALGAFYVLFFLAMVFRPGLLFSVIPSPEITTAALSDGSRTYLLFEKVDLGKFSPQEKRQPEVHHYIAELKGKERSGPREIPAYTRAVGAGGRIVFLFKGGYRTWEGGRLTETRSDAVGAGPRGAISPSGLYVLSDFEDGEHLNLITDASTTTIPLPQELRDLEGDDDCPCTRIVSYQGQPCLFWQTRGNIAWTAWNGSSWEPVVLSPITGTFQVLADDRKLYFFIKDDKADGDVLNYYVLANNTWTGPVSLPLPAGVMQWEAFLQQGRPRLFTRHFPSETLQTVDGANLVDAVRLPGPFQFGRMLGGMAQVALASNLLTVLCIFGVSLLLDKYKKRTWSAGETAYEFASLFRRFLAFTIDTLTLLLPPVAALALSFRGEDLARNPLLPVMLVLGTLVFLLLGSFLYHALLEGLLGQTLGKKICGIVVLKADFTPCTLGAGFLRNLLRIVDGFFYYLVAAVMLAATFKWQRLGDLAAETVVVRKRQSIS